MPMDVYRLVRAEPLTDKDKHTAEEFIRKYHRNIIDK